MVHKEIIITAENTEAGIMTALGGDKDWTLEELRAAIRILERIVAERDHVAKARRIVAVAGTNHIIEDDQGLHGWIGDDYAWDVAELRRALIMTRGRRVRIIIEAWDTEATQEKQ